ncbi:MAG: ABC transporter ATP-binding protein [Opitutaceae bacterium]
MPKTKTIPPILSVKNLLLNADGKTILKDINWAVERGQNWAILGANGSGKTSLLSTLTGYSSLCGGSMQCLGEDFGDSDWIELRKRIGMVSTSITRRVPNDELAIETVISGETAQLGLWNRDGVLNTAKALRCLSKLSARALANQTWGTLSQGERQKVFIARALMAKLELLILDEPCAGLDPVARERFLITLRKLAELKRSPSLILVTHHIEEIFPEITHVLLMKNGKVLTQGPKNEVLNSKNLSAAFGAKVAVRKLPKQDRWSLSLELT